MDISVKWAKEDLSLNYTNLCCQSQLIAITDSKFKSLCNLHFITNLKYFDCFSYGTGGEIAKSSIQCVLPMNMINQKVFTVLYYWLGLLLMASVMMLVLRIFLVISPTFRGICWSFIYGVDNINVRFNIFP